MKKLFYLIAGLFFSIPADAQLQNLDFENWDYPPNNNNISYNKPTGWINCTRWFGTEDAQFIERFVDPVDTIAGSRKCALRLFTWYNYMKDAAVQRVAFQQRPTALKGLYKYEQNFILHGSEYLRDTAQAMVLLSKWNNSLMQRDTIGFGLFSAPDSVKVFTEFRANIVYKSVATPDSITIFLDPSIIGRDPNKEVQNLSGGGASIFTVDRLSLINESPTGITVAKREHDLLLFPNPAQGQVSFKNLSGDAVITDLNGKAVYRSKLLNSNSIDVRHLNTGLYLLKIDAEEGIYVSRFLKQ